MDEKRMKNLGGERWGFDTPEEALRQVSDLCQQTLPLDVQGSFTGRSFHATRKADDNRPGVVAVRGELSEDNTVIRVLVELTRTASGLRVPAEALFQALAALNERVRPVFSTSNDGVTLGVELRIEAKPMSLTRANAFVAELKTLDVLAITLQAQLPQPFSDLELRKQYEGVREYLAPVAPWRAEDPVPPTVLEWAKETFDFLFAGPSSVALAAPFSSAQEFALALLARLGQEYGKSFGSLIPPAVQARGLVELARQAPGIVMVPALRLSLGTSPYEMSNEVQALLASLASLGKPVLFTGTYPQLQPVFHGGQGGASDPLAPIVRHVPDLPLDLLARFVVRSAGQLAGGMPTATEENLTNEVLACLAHKSAAEQQRILAPVANRVVNSWALGRATGASHLDYVERLSAQQETLAGLSDKPRAARSADVQERFTHTLTDPQLLPFLQEHLLAQDEALAQLTTHLRMESLTRPPHQPLRYCAQGTPATGKSESAVLLAQRLSIPYVNIDAASIPDYYTAAAQLLGSGRGIVGSHQSGRLEQAAKHHAGAVIEVSDLDHATPQVRAALADLFLQVLETGEAQSATGAMFSCANLIFAFTMNLPEGMDEAVRKGYGFNQQLSSQAIRARVTAEIKKHLSSAFLSRIGTPILFAPLEGEALAVIVERAIKAALRTAAERLHLGFSDVEIAAGTGAALIATLQANLTSFGARALLEQGRALAAAALLEFHQRNPNLKAPTLLVSATPDGTLVIEAASARRSS